MTSHLTQSPAQAPAETRAFFSFVKPIWVIQDGAEIELHGLDMRSFETADLPLLDQFQGQPIALMQHVVAAMCDITVDQVQQLCMEDFTMLAGEAAWHVSQFASELGLQSDFFFRRLHADAPVPEAAPDAE